MRIILLLVGVTATVASWAGSGDCRQPAARLARRCGYEGTGKVRTWLERLPAGRYLIAIR